MKRTITITVVVENHRDLERLAEAAELVEDAAGDIPWRPELRKAAETIYDVARRMRAERRTHG